MHFTGEEKQAFKTWLDELRKRAKEPKIKEKWFKFIHANAGIRQYPGFGHWNENRLLLYYKRYMEAGKILKDAKSILDWGMGSGYGCEILSDYAEKVIGYDTNAKVNPPLRTRRDIEALIQGLKENIIDIIVTDHAPWTEAEKRCEFALAPFGISGFETALGSLMSLVHDGRLTLTTLISKLTCEPARILGGKYDKLGTLAIGAPADITIYHPDMEWVVDTKTFASKGKNTPLAGATLKGKVMATITQGKLVYRE